MQGKVNEAKYTNKLHITQLTFVLSRIQAGLDVYSVSGDVGCQSCDCHAVGSVVSKCNEDTGQCLCRENVMGRRCDQCTEDFAGMDELGCKGKMSDDFN